MWVDEMKNEMRFGAEPTQATAAMKKLQVDVEKLQDAVKLLEQQMAKLPAAKNEEDVTEEKLSDPSHEAAVKMLRCKHCSHMRMPHRSNPHYTCGLRHETIEPYWTCGLFEAKHRQSVAATPSHASH